MAPASDFTCSVEAMKATLVLTNVVPQKMLSTVANGPNWKARFHDLAAEYDTV